MRNRIHNLPRIAAALCLLLSLVTAAQASERTRLIYSFEKGLEGWRGTEKSTRVSLSQQKPSQGRRALSVSATFPGTCNVQAEPSEKEGEWLNHDRLLVDVFVPQDAPEGLQVMAWLKDWDLNYYQNLRGDPLPQGKWTTVAFDIRPESLQWQYVGHFKPWDGYVCRRIMQFGLKFVSKNKGACTVLVDNVRIVQNLLAEQENGIYNLRVNTLRPHHYEKFEISFNLRRIYRNPYDPNEVDVRARFISPGGRIVSVPGFFFQGYLRRLDKREEQLIAMGRSQWKVRFSPTELTTGRKPYHCFVEVRDAEGVIRSKLISFECAERKEPAERNRGFVRISKKDPNYFEFDDGSWYYPVGFNIAAVGDTRARTMGVSVDYAEGTFAYDRFLQRMSENGINWGRVWMSPWSFSIEWTQGYNIHYKGVGYYNQANSWRLDHVLDTAQRRGVYIMLLFTGHGEIGNYESDFYGPGGGKRPELGSPYWTRNGGPIDRPHEIFTNAEARKLYKQKVRYILARWGYSTNIFAWELMNEVDLDQNMFDSQADEIAAFVRDVIRYMDELHPNRHLTTSGVYRITRSAARPLLSLQEIDFNTGHIFIGDLVQGLLHRLRWMTDQYDKIFLATEAGKTPFAQDPDLTAVNIRKTIWGSHMMPYAGAAAPWWWVLVDQRDLYDHFKALTTFKRGEDRRGLGLETVRCTVTDKTEKRSLTGLCLKNSERAYGWVYDPNAFETNYKWSLQIEGAASVVVPAMEPGKYRLEIWDSHEGKILEEREMETKTEVVRFDMPVFTSDIAFKLKRAQMEEEPAPPQAE